MVPPSAARGAFVLFLLTVALGGGAPVAGVGPEAASAQQIRRPDAPPDDSGSAALAGRSLLVPGWGQWAQGQRRAWAYGILEAALWTFWAQRRSSAADFRTRYRDLAWDVARYGTDMRSDGPWAYYETLSHWNRSGAYDLDGSAPGVQPETDPSTYNGSVWALARDLYFRGGEAHPGDPAYEAALSWYGEHAYGDAFLWDWEGREKALSEYRDLIERSDNRFQQATNTLGAVLANHLLSATDAFVSSRVPGQARIRTIPDPFTGRGSLWLTLSWTP